LASKLRARGLEVWIADGVESALTRARTGLPDVVLVSAEVEASLEHAVPEIPGLPEVPRFTLVETEWETGERALLRDDVEALAKRVHAVPVRSSNSVPEASDFRGDLTQVSLVDLIQLLSVNRRSGVLVLQTPLGAGEVRLGDGEVVDALYRRLEGKKALFRLLAEREGTFSFMGGASVSLLRRIDEPINALLMEGLRELDESRELTAALALGDDALIALVPPALGDPDIRVMVLTLLVTPRTLSEVLDDVPALDLEVLQVISGLLSSGAVRRITGGTRRIELADPDRLGVLAALAKRVARSGFRGAGRVAIAATPRQLLGLGASLGRIAEAMMPSESLPTTPIPHVLSTLRLTDGVDLEVLGVPLVEAYSPLWPVVLPGCMAIASLSSDARDTLESACQLAGVPIVDGMQTLGAEHGDDADPEFVALLIQRLLELAAGT
jgi:hypothetical protein